SASLDWGEGATHKGRYARQVAAALAWIGVSRHEPVRTYLLRGGTATPLQPAATRGEAAALFRQLGDVQDGGPTDLPGALRRVVAGSGGQSRGPVVLLTDLLDAAWPDGLRALAAFAAGNSPSGMAG